ncbi:MAG: cysteine desulfurase family protein [Candidatus Paceibacterota bacterium]|jgi:cysteine desulfurase
MVKSNKIYLDYAASVEANPSSIHSLGVDAKNKLQNARKAVASVLGSRPEEIIFTSGGTESNNLAIQGVVWSIFEMHTYSPVGELLCSARQPAQGISKTTKQLLPHIITTNIEHPSVLETFKLLEKRKLVEISIVPVEENGIVDPKKIKKEIKTNTILVSVMYANNEIGTIQTIREIAKEIRHFKKMKEINFFSGPRKKSPDHSKKLFPSFSLPLFHTDAVQAVNYLDLNVERLGVDLLSLSGSKIEGGGKVGVLYKRKMVKLANVYGGGDQEMGLRPGTENLAEILKFSNALKLAQDIKEKESKRLTKLRDYFFKKLLASQKNNFFRSSEKIPRPFKNHSFAPHIFNGDLKNRLPNNVNVTFPKIQSDLLVIELSAKGVMASSKSACKSSNVEGSYVIKAIHPEIDREIGGLRFSMGRQTTKKDIDYTIKVLSQVLTKLKKWYN